MVAMATDHVVNPQICQKTKLQYEYDVSKGVKFQELDFKLFVAGEFEIISSIKKRETKKRKLEWLFLKLLFITVQYIIGKHY